VRRPARPPLPPSLDRGELDLLPHLEPRCRAELAHAVLHVGLLRLLRRLTGTRWSPAWTNITERKERE
jgi:hypothetical protein